MERLKRGKMQDGQEQEESESEPEDTMNLN